MRRLISGSVVPVSLLFLAACSGDPTESLRGGVAQLDPAPSKLFLQQGKTTSVDVTATDDQGNQFVTAFSLANVGPGISVARDETFRPVFVNDSQTGPPAEDAIFRYRVTANDLVSSSFKITAEGKEATVPVAVTLDPIAALATVTTAGATAADPTVLSVAPPLSFAADVAVTFDKGAAIIVDRAADGSSVTIFPPPGTASTGNISGVGLSYIAGYEGSTLTNAPLSIATTVPSRQGTNDINTAPDITPASGSVAFYDGAAFTGADISGDCNPPSVPCPTPAQYYKFTLAADGDVTASVNWSNASDLDLVLCNDVACSAPNFDNATSAQPEGSTTYTLTAGTYYLDVVLFAGAKPDWISVSLQE